MLSRVAIAIWKSMPEQSGNINLKSNKMKKIVSVIFAITLAFAGMQSNTDIAGKISKANQVVKPLCDDEPIVMRSHVRNSGGFPISGATVSLKLVGTDEPQYSGTTDSNGDYTFDEVVQGNYHYKITASGYYTKNVSLGLHVNTERTDTLIAN